VVIVGGTFEVEPVRRDQYLTERHDLMRASRAEVGCIEYTFAADPLDPGRVVLFERWASQEDLDNHLAVLRAAPRESAPDAAKEITASISVFEVSAERTLR
jgi:quinol monooxygenase YgiN